MSNSGDKVSLCEKMNPKEAFAVRAHKILKEKGYDEASAQWIVDFYLRNSNFKLKEALRQVKNEPNYN